MASGISENRHIISVIVCVNPPRKTSRKGFIWFSHACFQKSVASVVRSVYNSPASKPNCHISGLLIIAIPAFAIATPNWINWLVIPTTNRAKAGTTIAATLTTDTHFRVEAISSLLASTYSLKSLTLARIRVATFPIAGASVSPNSIATLRISCHNCPNISVNAFICFPATFSVVPAAFSISSAYFRNASEP